MSEFEHVLLCFLIPIAYIVTYIAGKYDVISQICWMLEESFKKYKDKKESGENE